MSETAVFALTVLVFMVTCGFILLVFGGLIFFVVRGERARNRGWAELATRSGLTLKPGALFSPPEVSGSFRGRPLHAYIYSTGGSRYRRTHTAATLGLKNPANLRLQITQPGSPDSLFSHMPKDQDVKIGNPQFDARFVVRSDQPDLARKVLGSAAAQNGIGALPAEFRIDLYGESLAYKQRQGEEDPEVLMKVFNMLSDLAGDIER